MWLERETGKETKRVRVKKEANERAKKKKRIGSGRRKVLSRARNIGHLYLCDSVVHTGSYRVLTPRV